MMPDEQRRLDEMYMSIALQEAREAGKIDEVPIGAVVVCRGKIVGRGHNMTETLTDVTAHAEMLAITAAANNLGGKYLPQCTLYVTVEPCPMCAGAIGWSQMGRLVIGASDPKRGYRRIEKEGQHFLHPKTLLTEGILAEEASCLMKDFFRKRR